MKPETRTSFLNRSFRRSFKKKKSEDKNKPSPENEEEEQRKALAELRKVASDVIDSRHTEIVLHRFLKSQGFNVTEAEKLLRLDINFRKLVGIENFNNLKMPEVSKYLKVSSVIGFDKEGALIRYIKLGQADLKGMVHSISTITSLILVIKFMEKDRQLLEEENEKTGRNATQFLCILDLDGLPTTQILHKPVLDFAIAGLKRMKEHYYDIYKNLFIINAPSYFPSVYKLLKPALSEELSSKVQIFNSDDYKETLLQHVDAEVLPTFLGGSREDYVNDPKCAALVMELQPIPESFYAPPEEFLDPNDPSVETVTISAGGFVNIPVPILVAGSDVEYHINSKDNDLGMALYYEPGATVCHVEKFKKKDDSKEILSKLEQLSPNIRLQCHIKPEIGKILAWRAGVYIMHFDNTYSWMNSKQVCYKVKVVPPEDRKPTPDIVKSTKDMKL